MGKKLTKLLNKLLPFSGSKTILGGWIAALGGLSFLDLNLLDLIQGVSSGEVTLAGLALMVVGKLHAALKEKYGDK